MDCHGPPVGGTSQWQKEESDKIKNARLGIFY
jgi:hypothetical protein